MICFCFWKEDEREIEREKIIKKIVNMYYNKLSYLKVYYSIFFENAKFTDLLEGVNC
jgi:hypothetical protein